MDADKMADAIIELRRTEEFDLMLAITRVGWRDWKQFGLKLETVSKLLQNG